MQEKISAIPGRPGVYLFRNEQGRVIYVGKAKVLKNRVRSYFQKSSALDERKSAMMRSVADLEVTVTGNELEALILEANLIKQYKPRYNILLRDDKSYPYLKLTLQEKWPRLEVVRRIQKDGSRYFGPYVPAGAMWTTLSFIRTHYSMPTCRYSLEKRMRPCIQYQMKRCLGPCSGEVDHAEYMRTIREVQLLLEGNNERLIRSLKERMHRFSEELKYEEAAAVRDRVLALQSISEFQKVVSPALGDADVIGQFRQDDVVGFKVLFVRNGMMIGSREFVQRHAVGETEGFLMKNFIEQFYSREILPAPVLFCSAVPEDRAVLSEWLSGRRGSRVLITVPSRGIKRKLVIMARENAEEKLKSTRNEVTPDVMNEVALMLHMAHVPEAIGAFDISNITGKSAVGAYVLWERDGFDKAGYRHISLDAVPGPDDYAMMQEMIRRTFRSRGDRGQESGERNQETGDSSQESGERTKPGAVMPDLIIIDGGREHLNAALEALAPIMPPRAAGQGKTVCPAVIGLAKDPDRVFMQEREEPLLINDSRPASLLLRRIRDEVHRFAITFHKKKRAEKSFASVLDSIYGLGRKRRFALLNHFGSIEAIKKASVEDIAGLKGFTTKLAKDVLKSLVKN